MLENEKVKLYWDQMILTDETGKADSPDVLKGWGKDEIEKKKWLIDIAVPNVANLEKNDEN